MEGGGGGGGGAAVRFRPNTKSGGPLIIVWHSLIGPTLFKYVNHSKHPLWIRHYKLPSAILVTVNSITYLLHAK